MDTLDSQRVCRYFDDQAERFDAIYRMEKNWSQKVVDRLFRQVIHRRFALTFALCGEAAGKQVLDIGCGSGRYAVEFARRGARVVGLDFAPAMVAMAAEAARKAGVAERCHFDQADFLTWRAAQTFDICLAIGFFDYIEEPRAFLARVREFGPAQAVFSFPRRWTLRTPTRWLRLRLSGCPVYFYGERQVEGLLKEAGWEAVEIHRLSRDYIAHVRCSA